MKSKKGPVGRPLLPKDEGLNNVIAFRLTEAEFKKFKADVRNAHVTNAQYIRAKVLGLCASPERIRELVFNYEIYGHFDKVPDKPNDPT